MSLCKNYDLKKSVPSDESIANSDRTLTKVTATTLRLTRLMRFVRQRINETRETKDSCGRFLDDFVRYLQFLIIIFLSELPHREILIIDKKGSPTNRPCKWHSN
jgi:hypothetical protein